MKNRVISEYLEEIRDCFSNNRDHFRYDYKKLVLSKSGSDITFMFLPVGENKVQVECIQRPVQRPGEIKLLSAIIKFDEQTYQVISQTYQQIKEKYEQIDQQSQTQRLADLLFKFNSQK